MDRLFIDCNILLDWLIDRPPFSSHACQLISLIADKKAAGYVSPLVLANVHHILKRSTKPSLADRFLADFSRTIKILDITNRITEQAIAKRYRDFEDDIHYFTAISNRLDYIITRNKKDFRNHRITIMTAEEYLYLSG